jgi:hypothetical protein
MYRYIVKRILLMIPALLGSALFVFLLMRLIPGDVCELRLGSESTFIDEQAIQLCRERLGLTKPLPVQFLHWIGGFPRLDFGESMWTGRPVLYEIGLRFQLSLQVALMATITAIIIAIPLGTIAAIKQDTWIDYLVRSFSIAGLDAPDPIHPDLARSDAQSHPADLAGPGDRLPLFRSCSPHDPIGLAGSLARGLRAHGACQGITGKTRDQPARAQKCYAAGDYGGGH